MSTNSTELLVPARAYVYLAPVGTLAPIDVTTPLGAGWRNVGHTTEDSLSISTEPEFQDVTSHQSDYPIRRIQTSDSASVSVDLKQWNSGNLQAVFGGGTITQAGTGVFKFTPPPMGTRLEMSAVVELIDGTRRFRWVFPKVMQIEGVSNELQKGQEARLPLRLAVLGADGVDPWYLLTNDNASFTVTPPAPTLTAVAPATGPKVGGTSVTLTGTGLADTYDVIIGGIPAVVSAKTATSVTVTTGGGPLGKHAVTIVTPAGAATLQAAMTYTAT